MKLHLCVAMPTSACRCAILIMKLCMTVVGKVVGTTCVTA